jgi:hypothetical protein
MGTDTCMYALWVWYSLGPGVLDRVGYYLLGSRLGGVVCAPCKAPAFWCMLRKMHLTLLVQPRKQFSTIERGVVVFVSTSVFLCLLKSSGDNCLLLVGMYVRKQVACCLLNTRKELRVSLIA